MLDVFLNTTNDSNLLETCYYQGMDSFIAEPDFERTESIFTYSEALQHRKGTFCMASQINCLPYTVDSF